MSTTSNEGGDTSSGAQSSMMHVTVPVNILLPERMDLSGGNLPVKWQIKDSAKCGQITKLPPRLKTPKTWAEIT